QKANKGKDDPSLMIARGDIYQKTDAGGGEAMNSYERATMADPNNVLAFFKKGELNVRSRNYNEARTNFEKAVSLDPNYAPAYRDMAEMYYFANQYDLALTTFQKYLGLAEKSPKTDAEYAAFLFLTKKYPEALSEIQKVLQQDPNNVAMNRLQAYTLFETGQNDQALAAMDKYMKMVTPDKLIKDDNVYYGRMLSKAGRDDEALAVLTKAVQADPKNATAIQAELASVYAHKKDYSNAVTSFKASMGAGAPALTDMVLLGKYYELNKQYEKADSLYGAVLTARPTYAPGYLMRASANANLDPTQEKGLAKPYYEKYVELAKADPTRYKAGLVEAYDYLGSYYYLQKKDKATALPIYQQMLALDPENVKAKTAIGAINARSGSSAKPQARK
ncbi:MAG TPA: tetratricopeptide repeat protein, partial [Hymenobacter sp.]